MHLGENGRSESDAQPFVVSNASKGDGNLQDPKLEQAMEDLQVLAHQPTTLHDGEFVRNEAATLLYQQDCKARIVAASYKLDIAIATLFAQFEVEREEYIHDLKYTE